MRKWPTFVQGIVLVVCGVFLGIGGCLGYLMNSENMMGYLGGAAFFGGLTMLMVGMVLFIVGVLKGFFGLITPKQE